METFTLVQPFRRGHPEVPIEHSEDLVVPLSRWRAGASGLAVVAMVLAVAPPVSAAPVLLSQNKPVSVSSTGGDAYAGRNAVDGSTSTRWSSQKNIDPAWIYVDLGATWPRSARSS